MMKSSIKKIQVNNSGYVFCKSEFYSAHDILNSSTKYVFMPGINILEGEIDSGIWAISYLLSMYPHFPKNFIIFEDPVVSVNGNDMSLKELAEHTCYLDREYPLFSKHDTVYNQITKGLKKSKISLTPDEIKELFQITDIRIHRPLSGAGNEVFKAMAAIGYANNKQIYCFPWLSTMRFDGYHEHLKCLLTILESLEKIVIVPRGKVTIDNDSSQLKF